MMSIVNLTNAKGVGTFKAQYSLYNPVYKEPEFIPKDKRKAEFIITMYYSQFRLLRLNKDIDRMELTKDDSEKKPDAVITENGKTRTLQLTKLSFTKYEQRKAIAKQKSIALAKKINEGIKPDYKLNVNIFPKERKNKIPLKNIKHKKDQIEKTLIDFIVAQIKANTEKLKSETQPVWISVDLPVLSDHFSHVALNAIPPNGYSRFYGINNIFVNYDINDVSFDVQDIEETVADIFRKKNGGKADILLIWANVFELSVHAARIADEIKKQFTQTSFSEVFLMSFEDNVKLFQDSLQLWPIKVIDWNDKQIRI